MDGFELRIGRMFGVLAIVVALLAGLSTPVSANVSFSVMPGLLDLVGEPGSSGTHELTVRNTGDEPMSLTIGIVPYPNVATERSAVSWMSTPEAQLVIEAGDEATVPVRVSIPEEIETGGYYGRVSLSTTDDAVEENSAALAGELLVGFMITVEGDGDLVRAPRIGRFAPVLQDDGRIGFQAEFVNDGNVHLISPRGSVSVAGPDGPIGSLEFPETTPSLPGTTTLLTTQGSLPLADGETYRAEATFAYLDSDDDAPLTVSLEFTNEAVLAVGATDVCENLDRGPTLALTVTNNGAIGLQPQIRLGVVSASNGSLGSSTTPAGETLWPGESRLVSIDYPERLASGEYEVTTTVQFDPRRDPAIAQTPFQIGGLEGDPIPLCEAA